MASYTMYLLLALCIALVVAQDGDYDYGGGGGGDGGFDGGDIGGGGGDFDFQGSNVDAQVTDPEESHFVRRRSIDEQQHLRVRRSHQGRVGPVHTHVKTYHDGDFKWGVKHMVGRHFAFGGGHH